MLLHRFRQDQRGNIAPLFALAVLPIVGLVGAAVDYSRANSVRTSMQAALDATALAMSKLAPTLTSTQLQTQANSYFQALFSRPDASGVSITTNYTTSGGSQLTISGSATVATSFMKMAGYQNLPVGSSSTVKWGNTRLRVALALDNTGSMADDGKIAALKTATTNLLSQLRSAATNNGDVYVSVIPFNRDVNVGAANYNANWIDWSDWEDDNGHDASTTTCTTQKFGRSGRTTRRCTTSTSWIPDAHNTWNGCVTDRDKPYDTQATAPNPADANLPDTATSTLFPADQYDSCPLQMKGLSYDWSGMNTLVGQMYPAGNTNQAIGLSWAWLSLTGGGPLTAPAMDSNYKYNQVIILLTDGLNTQDRWWTDQNSIDARQKITCDNIKQAGITLYTVQVNTGGDPTSTLLQNCASTSDKFFLLTNANQMVTTFSTIGTQLSQLRISK